MNMLPDPVPHHITPIPFEAFRAELMRLYAPPLRAKATATKMRQTLGLVAALVGSDATTAALSPELIAQFVSSRPPAESPNTTRGLLSNLRAACAYAELRGYLRVSPFRYRQQWVRRADSREGRHHSMEEIRRVLELLRHEAAERSGWAQWRSRRLYALACTVAYTGLRRNEALYLHAADVDLPGGILHIVARAGRRLKTEHSGQPIPIPPPLAPVLADWLAHRLDAPTTAPDVPDPCAARPIVADCPWLFPNVTRLGRGPWTGGPTGQKPLDRLVAAGNRAGVPGFTFLSLRHSWATHAESWGLSELMVQRILRHTTRHTQRHYRHADAANLRAAVRGVGFGPTAGDETP